MARFGFCGPTYSSESVNVDSQRCMNWLPEVVESPSAASAIALYPCWGLKLLSAIASGSLVTQLYSYNTRLFGTTGTGAASYFFELNSAGTAIQNLPINGDGLPADLIANNVGQLLIRSGPYLGWFDMNANVLHPVTTPPQSTLGQVDFIDGYFLGFLKGTQNFQWSNLENADVWDPLDIAQISLFAENITGMMIVQRNIWFFSPSRVVAYADVGDPNNPFQPIPGAFIEQGLSAPDSPIRLNNQLFWIGANESGEGMAWGAQGWTPKRVSTHAVETAWQRYSTISDAVSFSYQQHGHFIWEIYFPTANATWCFDTDSGMWHERGYWNQATAAYTAHRARCHAYCFGKHFVGDISSASIFQMSPSFYDDNGNQIRRFRRAPHVTSELEPSYHHKLRVHLETGLGPSPPLVGTAVGLPYIVVQDSTGVQWQVCVIDNGVVAPLQSIGTGLAPPRPYIFQDIASITPAWYQIVIAPGGSPISLVPVSGVGAGFLTRLPMITNLNGLQGSLSVQNGVLTSDPPTTPVREPQVMLRYSDDGGHSWSNEYTCGAGMQGDFRRRVEFRRLGRTRDRVYEIAVSDPIPWRIVDAYLFATPNFEPVERYAAQMGKMA